MFMIALTVIVLNLVVDLTHAFLDARIRSAAAAPRPQRDRVL
jgi:ABC-type dipeptide/oligopeptide/nickel transport system permease component